MGHFSFEHGIYRRLYNGATKGRRINAVSMLAECLFWRLHCICDDFGTFLAEPDMLLVDALPKRREVKEDQLKEWLGELEKVRLVRLFEVDGERFGKILDFERLQPAGKNGRRVKRHPFPTDGASNTAESSHSNSNVPHSQNGASKALDSESGESKNPDSFGSVGGGVQKIQSEHKHEHKHDNEHTPSLDSPIAQSGIPEGEHRPSAAPAVHASAKSNPSQSRLTGFKRFWSVWPEQHWKSGEEKCERVWEEQGCEPIADLIVERVKIWKASEGWQKERGKFIPSPLRFLQERRWEAPPPPAAAAISPDGPPPCSDVHTEAERRAILGDDGDGSVPVHTTHPPQTPPLPTPPSAATPSNGYHVREGPQQIPDDAPDPFPVATPHVLDSINAVPVPALDDEYAG